MKAALPFPIEHCCILLSMKTTFAVLVLFLASVASSLRGETPADSANKARELLHDAFEFYSTGRYDLSIKRCNQVLELEPENVSALAQREIAKRKGAAERAKVENQETERSRAFHPTWPLKEIGRIRGAEIYK
jgi:hypothetical protein